MAGPLGQPAEAKALCREILTTWPAEVAAEDALKLYVELGWMEAIRQLAAQLLALADTLRPYEIVAALRCITRPRA